ncbi:MAG: hypothetical protein BJ554DRAFT_8006 [Olpidium bornovanus]|uniref:Uncharacterized protein n=1 Tax=Olpidium bornovanus TaxID=278681 RepID=A0A8H8A2A1_9FUNG|nr:MAG: hypothetical protein BJ554DRAFT_8006 [Olpidium bornovanus]
MPAAAVRVLAACVLAFSLLAAANEEKWQPEIPPEVCIRSWSECLRAPSRSLCPFLRLSLPLGNVFQLSVASPRASSVGPYCISRKPHSLKHFVNLYECATPGLSHWQFQLVDTTPGADGAYYQIKDLKTGKGPRSKPFALPPRVYPHSGPPSSAAAKLRT